MLYKKMCYHKKITPQLRIEKREKRYNKKDILYNIYYTIENLKIEESRFLRYM